MDFSRHRLVTWTSNKDSDDDKTGTQTEASAETLTVSNQTAPIGSGCLEPCPHCSDSSTRGDAGPAIGLSLGNPRLGRIHGILVVLLGIGDLGGCCIGRLPAGRHGHPPSLLLGEADVPQRPEARLPRPRHRLDSPPSRSGILGIGSYTSQAELILQLSYHDFGVMLLGVVHFLCRVRKPLFKGPIGLVGADAG